MSIRTALAAALLATACSSSTAAPASPIPPTPPVPANPAPNPLTPGSAALQNLRFLAGTWQGESEGKVIEERWSEPLGGSQVGTFRVLDQGKAVFYELSVLEQGEDALVLHMRHFGPALSPKGELVAFRLAKHGPAEAVFENVLGGDVKRLTYRREGESLVVTLERVKGSDTYRFRRTAS